MRIALFTDTYLPQKNGVAVAVNQLKHELVKLGHDVYVYTIHIPSEGGEIEEQVLRSRALLVPRLGADENLLAFPSRHKTLKQLKSDNIDIIHTHTELPQGFLGRYCAKALGIPHIHTVHTMWADYRHYLFRGRLLTERNVAFIYHIFLRKTTAVITPSMKAQLFLERLSIKGVHINNGVDEENFAASLSVARQNTLRQQLGIELRHKVIIFVGRLAPEKRAIPLFEVLASVMQQRKDVISIFIGEGVDAETMKHKAVEKNISNKCFFMGKVEHHEIANYYAISDIYVTVSLSEVQPMTLIEALLSSLPIISRQDSAYNGLVMQNQNGGQYATDAAVLEAILELLDNPELLASYSAYSRTLSQKFTARANAEETLSLYHRALEAGRPEAFHKGPLVYDE
ncbi:glycosyltransferase [Entomospira nematocerorum]|uniref:Glycosyltransferase family 4 protein n=1 Tax=Entomospira nematocerorum TaxID=2719987 RepID=A0A968GHD7_9SPIO|nr:glycosyltransferase [Entomospira nematocera]NIZ47181.1 glycosyltransferase family 4 protein [Entomospira nematocera]WDI34276.1 glycosyltransferase [Entomospira nematocera]